MSQVEVCEYASALVGVVLRCWTIPLGRGDLLVIMREESPQHKHSTGQNDEMLVSAFDILERWFSKDDQSYGKTKSGS